jgi:hypothetical protein
VLVVEGVGGLLLPLTLGYSIRDFAAVALVDGDTSLPAPAVTAIFLNALRLNAKSALPFPATSTSTTLRARHLRRRVTLSTSCCR